MVIIITIMNGRQYLVPMYLKQITGTIIDTKQIKNNHTNNECFLLMFLNKQKKNDIKYVVKNISHISTVLYPYISL